MLDTFTANGTSPNPTPNETVSLLDQTVTATTEKERKAAERSKKQADHAAGIKKVAAEIVAKTAEIKKGLAVYDKAVASVDAARDTLAAKVADVEHERVRLGKLLAALKPQIGHGEWIKYCEKHFNRSERDIQRLMKIGKAENPAAAHAAGNQERRTAPAAAPQPPKAAAHVPCGLPVTHTGTCGDPILVREDATPEQIFAFATTVFPLSKAGQVLAILRTMTEAELDELAAESEQDAATRESPSGEAGESVFSRWLRSRGYAKVAPASRVRNPEHVKSDNAKGTEKARSARIEAANAAAENPSDLMVAWNSLSSLASSRRCLSYANDTDWRRAGEDYTPTAEEASFADLFDAALPAEQDAFTSDPVHGGRS